MDNFRVLHGRKAFALRSGASRHVEGGYIDWDSVYSTLRVLSASTRRDT